MLGPTDLASNIIYYNPSAHDQINVSNPKLAPLTDNGGPTLTHRPLYSSPVLDAGNEGSVFGTPPATDQRGFARTFRFA